MKTSLIIVMLLVATFTTAVLLNEIDSSSFFEIAFFDVGQGDAIFFETPQGHQILIDGGPDATVLSRLGDVMPFWDKTLDLVILTHPDADHITGLVAVLERYNVKNVLWTKREKDTKVFEAFKEALIKKETNVILAKAGQKIFFGNSRAMLEILYPEKEINVQEEKSNETSIILRLNFSDTSILFTGDTIKKIEQRLIEQGVNIRANILKIAHHGSETSSSPAFLEAVNPKIAIISVGQDNRFGHPSKKVLANLEEYGINVHRTDKEGTIFLYFK